MTVKQLICELTECDPWSEVVVFDDVNNESYAIEEISFSNFLNRKIVAISFKGTLDDNRTVK